MSCYPDCKNAPEFPPDTIVISQTQTTDYPILALRILLFLVAVVLGAFSFHRFLVSTGILGSKQEREIKREEPKKKTHTTRNYCSNCGSKIAPSDKFCSSCGEKVR